MQNSAQLHLPSLLKKTAFLLILFGLSLSSAFAACHTVSPTGSGAKTGADWNNAYAGLPSTLVRGDIYYLADGSYGSYTFNTATSGTTTVEVRKAQSYDNCTSTGWNTATMGSSQAVFATAPEAFKISDSYFILNGNGQQKGAGCGGTPTTPSSEPSTPSDCGIRVDNSSCSSSGTGACNYAIHAGGASNITLEYVEVAGNGNNISENALIGDTITNLTANHVFGRNAGCDFIQWVGANQVIEHSYWWMTNTSSSDTCHPQYESFDSTTGNDTEFANVYRDINGSAVISFTNPGSGVHNGLYLYDNVFWQTSGGAYTTTGLDDGIIGVLQGSLTNMMFVQNTLINLAGNATGWYGASSGQSGTIQNNIIYNSGKFSLGNGTWTEGYNSYLGTTPCAGSGTSDVCSSSASNPFTGWTTGIFTLASDNADWNNRVSLAAPYTTDAAGNAFTTDRGAYQFVNAALGSPTNVSGTAPPQ